MTWFANRYTKSYPGGVLGVVSFKRITGGEEGWDWELDDMAGDLEYGREATLAKARRQCDKAAKKMKAR